MKVALSIFFVLIAGVVFAQDPPEVPKDKWSKDLFISDEFCAGKGLKPAETNPYMCVWNGGMTAGEKIRRLADIRYYFETPEEAASYLKTNAVKLSERGGPVESKIKIPGGANLRIFDEGEAGRKLNKSLGIESHYYFFIFTVKNYICKVFYMSEEKI